MIKLKLKLRKFKKLIKNVSRTMYLGDEKFFRMALFLDKYPILAWKEYLKH